MKRETLQPDDQLVITDRECASVKHWMIDAMWNLCAGARFFHSTNHAPHVQLQGQRAKVNRRTSSSDSMGAPSRSRVVRRACHHIDAQQCSDPPHPHQLDAQKSRTCAGNSQHWLQSKSAKIICVALPPITDMDVFFVVSSTLALWQEST